MNNSQGQHGWGGSLWQGCPSKAPLPGKCVSRIKQRYDGAMMYLISQISIFKCIFNWVDVSGWGHKENNFVHKIWHKCEVCGHLLHTLQQLSMMETDQSQLRAVIEGRAGELMATKLFRTVVFENDCILGICIIFTLRHECCLQEKGKCDNDLEMREIPDK